MAENEERLAPLADLSKIAPTPDVSPKKIESKINLNDEDGISQHSTIPMETKNNSTLSSKEGNQPKIPDGGWGWMVVLSSLIISFIQDGISFSLGILQPEFVEVFNTTHSKAAWIESLFLALPLLSGPIMSALVDKYGCRSMTIVGGLVSAAGFIFSYFANTIIVMYITFGIISGLGLGLTYITAVVSIAFWFDKKRNLAVGLGACGTGLGTIAYAPFTALLLNEFGWRGTVLLLSGTLLNICVCGAVMRDPDWITEQNKQNSKLSSKTSSESNISVVSQKINLEDIRNLLKSGQNAEYILQTLATSIEPAEDKGQPTDHYQSVLNLPTFIKEDEAVPIEVLEQLSENKKIYKIIVQNYPSLLHCRSTSEKGLNKLAEDPSLISRIPVTFSLKIKKTEKPKLLTHQYSLPEDPSVVTEPLLSPQKKTKLVKNIPQVDKSGTTPWLVKQFSTTAPHQNYFKNMRFPRHSITHRGVVLNKNKYKLRASSCPDIYKVSMTTLVKEEDEHWYTKLINSISLFFEFHFLLMSLSTIILFAWFMTPYLFLVDHMMGLGYTEEDGSIVLSVIGAANTIGMVGFGWAGDQKWANVLKIYAVCLMLCGLCCSAMYFFSINYIVLNFFGVLYGIFLASSFSFTPVILVELLPLDTFTKAYGLQLMCQGIGHLGGPPFAGLLKDITHTWSYSFHLAGGFIALSGFLILLIPLTKNRKLIGTGPVEKELANEKV